MRLRWLTSLAIFRLAISCATIGLAQISLAQAAEFTTAVSKEGQTILALDGGIEAGDGLKLAWIIRALNNEKRHVSALYLNSPGGKHPGAVQMAEVVKRYKISTIVPDGAECVGVLHRVRGRSSEVRRLSRADRRASRIGEGA
jgi:hypothetical protein